MPRYFLHQRTSMGYIKDPDGSELPDLDAAREEALAGARDLWASAIREGADLTGDSFEIQDETGQPVLNVAFTDALPASLRARLAADGPLT